MFPPTRLGTVLASVLIISVAIGCHLLPVRAVFAGEGGEDTNLIRNGDFKELQVSGHLADWGTRFIIDGNTPEGYAGLVDPEAFNGSPAIKYTGGEGNGRVYLNQREVLVGHLSGKTLKLSAWYQGDDVVKQSNGNNHVRVEFYFEEQPEGASSRNSGSSKYLHGPEGTTDGWIELTMDVVVPEDTYEIWVAPILQRTSGTVWWSALTLTEVK